MGKGGAQHFSGTLQDQALYAEGCRGLDYTSCQTSSKLLVALASSKIALYLTVWARFWSPDEPHTAMMEGHKIYLCTLPL